MTPTLSDTDECDPPTDAHGDHEHATVAGASATLHFHHLQAMLATLAPLRGAYVTAAAEPLRALPLDARRAVLPHVLREHPALATDARVRALADEVLLDTDATTDRPDVVRWLARIAGVRASSATDALDRVERSLALLASSTADLSRVRGDVLARLAGHADDHAVTPPRPIPDEAAEVLAWTLEGSTNATATEHAREVGAALAGLVVHAMSVPPAARNASLAMLDARHDSERAWWWARPIADAARWIEGLASPHTGAHPHARFDAAFARAYFELTRDEA